MPTLIHCKYINITVVFNSTKFQPLSTNLCLYRMQIYITSMQHIQIIVTSHYLSILHIFYLFYMIQKYFMYSNNYFCLAMLCKESSESKQFCFNNLRLILLNEDVTIFIAKLKEKIHKISPLIKCIKYILLFIFDLRFTYDKS